MTDLKTHLLNQLLSRREIEVAILAGETALNARELAKKLYVCPKTIRFHLTNVYRKLGFKRRGELIHYIGTYGKDAS